MGGFFGVASSSDCTASLFYGTDYHSHLGTRRGGMAVWNGKAYSRVIHDISNAQFRSKFELDISEMAGATGIGVISDFEDQPLMIHSHLGTFAIVTVGVIRNAADLANRRFRERGTHFTEMTDGEINPTELAATLINEKDSFAEGIAHAQQCIDGSLSLLILHEHSIIAARDRYGRTPVQVGGNDDSHAVTFESCAFPNLNYQPVYELGPGEIMRVEAGGYEQLHPPGDMMQICAFLWIYYGYPATSYEGRNVEQVRNRCGEILARNDDAEVDCVAGVPDSGVAHALGYANATNLPYQRPFVKYTPTWPRSFMPPDQRVRELVARMKLIPVPELIADRRLLFCEDSIVRGTQLRDTVQLLYDNGAKEVHMRPACPPLAYGCKFLNFSRSKSVMDLAARRAVRELEGTADEQVVHQYTCGNEEKTCAMVDRIRKRLGLTTLKYQDIDGVVEAIGLPKDKLCTYCWDGCDPTETP